MPSERSPIRAHYATRRVIEPFGPLWGGCVAAAQARDDLRHKDGMLEKLEHDSSALTIDNARLEGQLTEVRKNAEQMVTAPRTRAARRREIRLPPTRTGSVA